MEPWGFKVLLGRLGDGLDDEFPTGGAGVLTICGGGI